jgi:hypothetical protein
MLRESFKYRFCVLKNCAGDKDLEELVQLATMVRGIITRDLRKRFEMRVVLPCRPKSDENTEEDKLVDDLIVQVKVISQVESQAKGYRKANFCSRYCLLKFFDFNGE